MSTHGCFATSFPPYPNVATDDGSQEPDDTIDDYYYPEGAYYNMTAANDLE